MDTKTAAAAEKLNDSVRAVGRALDILLAFEAGDGELSASDLLKRVELSRPTLYRLLHTLETKGFITSGGEPQRFRLGPAVAKLVHVWTSSLNLAEVAAPVLRSLWDHTGETVALFVQQDAHRTCVAELPSAEPLSFKRGVGYSERIILGASGRAILAHAPVSDDTLADYARGTSIDVDKYRRELERVRKRGYAVSKEELLRGAVAIAAPFFNASGEVMGSIVVFGPDARLTNGRIDEIGERLTKEARALSRMLGKA